MAWIGYQTRKLSIIEKIKFSIKGYGWLTYKTEFRLVPIMNTDDFLYYTVDKCSGKGLKSGWDDRSKWNFVKIPIRSFREFVAKYRNCKYHEVLDFCYNHNNNASEISDFVLVCKLLENYEPDTSSPESLAEWLKIMFG